MISSKRGYSVVYEALVYSMVIFGMVWYGTAVTEVNMQNRKIHKMMIWWFLMKSYGLQYNCML